MAPKPVPDEAMAANEVDAPVPHEQLLLQPPQAQADGTAPEPQVHAGAGRFASGSCSFSGAARFAGSLINAELRAGEAVAAYIRGVG